MEGSYWKSKSIEESSIYVLHKSDGESGESSNAFLKSGAGDQIFSEKVSIIEDDTSYGFTLVTTHKNNEIVHFSKNLADQMEKCHGGDFEILNKEELEIEDKWFTIDLPQSPSSGNPSKSGEKGPGPEPTETKTGSKSKLIISSPRNSFSSTTTTTSSIKLHPLSPLEDPPAESEWKYRYSNEPIPISSLLIKNDNYWSKSKSGKVDFDVSLTESECEGPPSFFIVDGYYENKESKKCCPFF